MKKEKKGEKQQYPSKSGVKVLFLSTVCCAKRPSGFFLGQALPTLPFLVAITLCLSLLHDW
jgi:hypothetical protein